MTTPKRLWIDTDPGHDDAMALLLLAQDPRIEIIGVSTVAGNVPIEQTTRNARFILNAAGRSDIPVYAGYGAPLVRDQIIADVHGETGLDGLALDTIVAVNSEEALPALERALTESQEPLTILALGPLTNLARLIQRAPQLIDRIESLVIMGGAIAVPGNKSRVAEFNIFCDPEAAKIVFDAPVKKILVPLDPCNDIVLQEDDIARFSDNPIGTMLRQMLVPYIENICRFEGVKGALMYDPIAAYFLLEPDAFGITPMDVKIETNSEAITYGMTVAERRVVADKNININVVTTIDGKRFIDTFIQTINNNF